MVGRGTNRFSQDAVIQMTEQELQQQIQTDERAYGKASKKVSKAKMAWLHAESAVIEIKIRLDNNKELLRRMKYANPIQPPTLRELEIEAFRDKMPDLLKKIS